jgi:erythromycin esterase
MATGGPSTPADGKLERASRVNGGTQFHLSTLIMKFSPTRTPWSEWTRRAFVRRLAAACVVAFISGPQAARAQQSDEGFVRWARAHAMPIQPSEVDVGVADLQPLRQLVGNARVLALGEPAHGTHELLAFRNRLFRFLVENLGFTAIALESGLAESHRVAEFVGGGPGNAEELARNLTWGAPPLENVELLRWMHDYNADPTHRRKVRLYGFDMQLIGVPGDTTPSHVALDAALTYLGRVDTATAQRMRTAFEPYLNRLSVARYASLSPMEHDGLTSTIDDLIAVFERERPAFVSAAPEADFEWAYRNAVVARQTERMIRVQPPDTPGSIPPGAWRAASTRDVSMADNARWILEQQGPGGRVLIYAHDAHIKNAPTEGGVWNAFQRPPNAMGQYLRSALGSDLVIIGTSSSRNTIVPAAASLHRTSLDAALERVGVPLFLLDLRRARDNAAAASWLAARQSMQANFVSQLTLSPLAAFDALLFIESLSSARTLSAR